MIKSNIISKFDSNIEKVWNIVTDNKNYLWRSDLSKIEIIDENNFIEYDKNNFKTYFKITRKDYLNTYEFEIENKNIKGRWIGKFKKIDDNITQIDFTEEIEVDNFIMKLFAKPYLKSQQKRYINDLKKIL